MRGEGSEGRGQDSSGWVGEEGYGRKGRERDREGRGKGGRLVL